MGPLKRAREAIATRTRRQPCLERPQYEYERSGQPRYGHGAHPHRRLEALLARREDAFRCALQQTIAYRTELIAIPARQGVPGEPYWLNEWLPGLDAAALYGLLRARAPARYVEVGAGLSTAFAARARRDGALDMIMTAIDPHPRADVTMHVDELMRSPLQEVDLGLFDVLGAGDVVFVDGSHRAVMNSDVVVFHLEVLPKLPPGVLVGVHDVFLPADYPPDWADWDLSEQYLLAAYLLAGAPFVRPVLSTWYASHHAALDALMDPLWSDPRLAKVDRRGWSLWFETGAEEVQP